MRIIIPMAGIGKRMRPHTLTVPKPLIKIAGKPIVQRLVEQLMINNEQLTIRKIDEIAFVIGDFGTEVENNLLSIAGEIGAKRENILSEGSPGATHAIYCAKESIKGEVIIAFADTLFKGIRHKTQDTRNSGRDGTIWVHKVKDPSMYGVVQTDKNDIITDFVEKPKINQKSKIKNQKSILYQAIIGIYYIKDGENFRDELKHQIDNKIMQGGEYQLTDALLRMMKKGKKFSTAEVEEWLDCGNKNSTVYTNQRILEFEKSKVKNQKSKEKGLILKTEVKRNSIIIPPCYLGEDVEIVNSIIGPYVSVGNKTKIERSVISNSIIQSNSEIRCATLENSMIGNFVGFKGELNDVSIGDYTEINSLSFIKIIK